MMRRTAIVLIVVAGLAAALYYILATPAADFVLETRDGTGTLTYRCTTENGEAEASARAAAAHEFFQDQIKVVSDAAAKGMQDATDTANAAGTTPDFGPVQAVQADLMAATVSVVQQLYGCTVAEPVQPE